MSARASFLASAFLAALPLAAAVIGLGRLLGTQARLPDALPMTAVCQVAYEQSFDRAGHIGIAILLAIIFAFSARAIWTIWQAWRSTAHVSKRMSNLTSSVSDSIARLQEVSPRGARIEVVDSDSPFAVTLGYLRPRILLSSQLVEMLNDAELEAVIRHEFVHAARLDPLRVLLAEFFRAGLPFVPVLLYLLDQFRLRQEIEADAAVVSSMSGSAPLASALSKVLSAMPRNRVFAAAPGLNPTEARIDALLGRSVGRHSLNMIVFLTAISCLSMALMTGTLYVLFSRPDVVIKHFCWPVGL